MNELIWKPIETCPKTIFTHYIVGYDSASVWIVRDAYFNDDTWVDIDERGWWSSKNSVGTELLDDNRTPTHWLCETPKAP